MKGGEQQKDQQHGGKKRSSKKASKKNSKKDSMKGGKRELPPALKAAQVTNEKILTATGVDRSNFMGLIKFVGKMRDEAKKSVKDTTDYTSVNKKLMEVFEDYLEKHGKSKVAKEIEGLTEEIRAKRKKGSKKN